MTDTSSEVAAGIAALESELGTEAVVEFIGLFTDDAADLVDAMRAAAATGDVESLRRASHTLKSTSASLGALSLADRCKTVESLARSGDAVGAVPLVTDAAERCAEVLAALAVERARRAS